MKKLIIIASALLFGLVACTKFESESPIPVENATDPTITVTESGDTGFKATIAAAQGTGFYSYAVLPGGVQDLNPETLLKVGYKAPYEGTVDYAKSPSYTVRTEELSRNAKYTVYAVAASVQGTIGKVVAKEILTSDTQNPEILDKATKDSIFQILISESVSYVESKAVTADYYGVNSTAFKNEGTPVGTAEVKVTVNEDIVTFEVVNLPDGAYYAINFPEGAFVDALNNPLPAVSSRIFINEEGKLSASGLYGRKDLVNFDLDIFGGKPVTSVKNTTDAIWISVPEYVTVASADSKAVGEVTYVAETESHTYQTTYGLDFGWNSRYNCALTYTNSGMAGRPDPERGNDVTIKIPVFLTDIYGNKNNEFVIGPFLFSYGYTLDDVLGTYVNPGASGFGAEYDEEPFSMVVEKSDNADKGNVMVTEYYGLPTKIYADFDFDLGTFTMPIYYEPLGVVSSGNYFVLYYAFGYYSCMQDEGNDLQLVMTESGKFTDGNDYPGYYYEVYNKPASGNIGDLTNDDFAGLYDYNVFFPEFTRSAAGTASVSTKAPSKEFKTFQKGNFVRVRK